MLLTKYLSSSFGRRPVGASGVYFLTLRRCLICCSIFSPVKTIRVDRVRMDLKCSMSEAIAFRSFNAAAPDTKPLQCWSSALRFASTEGLAELFDEICCPEVGVAVERLDCFVATNSSYLYRVQAFLEETGYRLMPEVMEPQITE